MTRFVSILGADGRVQKFEPEHFVSARDQPDGVCLVTTRAGMFGTPKNAAEVEAEVQKVRAARSEA